MLVSLFLKFFQIGILSIGGGYAVIPMIQEEVVEKAGWISEKIFTDIITISQMTPGPLAVNTSTFVGLQIAGILGAVLATVGCVLGGVLISLTLYRFFQKHKDSKYVFEILNGLKSSSLGLIVAASITIVLLALFNTSNLSEIHSIASMDIFAIGIFILIFILNKKTKINPIWLIVVSGVIGLVVY